MLHHFLVANRDAVIARTCAMVAARGSPALSAAEQAANGIPAFLDQLVVALRRARSTDVTDHAEIAKSGALHGADLLRMGLSISQVVRDYGDVCQTITELLVEQSAAISPAEYQTLNLCLDDATAEAVNAHALLNQRASDDEGTERLGVFAHEARNLLNSAMLALDSISSGRVSATGSTGTLLNRSLVGLRDLIDRSLAEVRLDAGSVGAAVIPVSAFLEEIGIAASMEARSRDVPLEIRAVDRSVAIEGDRQTLAAALTNLLQNAFKFTHHGGKVSLTTLVVDGRVLFEVEDECGGLPAGLSEDLFLPFSQRSADRSGLGLGLTICRRAAIANRGTLRVRDLPGKGCVFTLDLPLHSPARHGA